MLKPVDALKILNENRTQLAIGTAVSNDDRNVMLKRWLEVYYSVTLHTKGARPKFKRLRDNSEWCPPFYFGEEYQNLFDNLLFSKHPREDEVTRQWRYSQYRPLTQAPLLRIIEVITGAIFQDSQYVIELSNKDDDDYIKGNNFEGSDGVKYDLMSYFAQIILLSIFEDANGFIVRMPTKPWYAITENKIPVMPYFVRSVDVIYPPDGDDFIFQSQDGKYAYWLNRVAIFRYRKADPNKGEQGNWVLDDLRGYYSHLLGYIPISKAGGYWNTEGFYNSYLFKSIPIADEFISTFSAEQMVDKEASHPFIQVATVDCPTCEGQGQIQKQGSPCADCPGGYEYELVQCPTCRGRKQVSFNPGNRFEAPAGEMDKDLVKIVTPEISVNEYHRRKNEALMQDLLDSLGLLMVQEAQSGAAKAIDQEKLYQFINTVCSNLFDNIIFSTIRDIIGYRNVRSVNGTIIPDFQPFKLIKPSQFQIKTAADLLAEIKESSNAQIPAIIRRELILEYMDKRFGGDETLQKKAKFIADLDKAFIYSPGEKASMKMSGELTPEDLFLSVNLPSILDEIEREKGVQYFDTVKFEALKTEVEARLAKIPQPTPAEQPPTNQA